MAEERENGPYTETAFLDLKLFYYLINLFLSTLLKSFYFLKGKNKNKIKNKKNPIYGSKFISNKRIFNFNFLIKQIIKIKIMHFPYFTS